MMKVLTLACLLATAAQYVAAQCNIPQYAETLIPQCAPNDVYIKWPNYANPRTYYMCNGAYNPVQMSCQSNEYFCYVLQQCVDCSQYIPPVRCAQLKTQNAPRCVPVGSYSNSTGGTEPNGPIYPTPIYPSSSTTTTQGPQPSETTTTTTTAPTTTTTSMVPPTMAPPTMAPPTMAPPTMAPPTPPGPPTESPVTKIPPPPSPTTLNPDIPTPPTPGPTPPYVAAEPPSVPLPPSESS